MIGGTSSAQKLPIIGGTPSVKNHLNISANRIMPPISDGWFLTGKNLLIGSFSACYEK